ncbi:MAG: DoxX family protein [Gemmatimonadetes bacterium]|nr:DoxX family protein [Gemmatimonadota bacterium]MBI2401827.1 DoxX family protein [Gemmatimonadota bacterium]MBI2614509.1 DoxX family protein [Gemmatimonadota bacterium]MBI3082609.1 DoxX family protein [Gemmatimonadota bacterium]
MLSTFMQRLQPISYNALRIVAGLAFMTHGGQKLFGLFGAEQPAAPIVPFGMFLDRFWPFGMAGLLEFFGGLLMTLGLFTPQVAFVIAGEMAVTYFWRHWGFGDRSIWWWGNRGELPLLYCYIWLLFWGHGSGSFSLDAWLAKRKKAMVS